MSDKAPAPEEHSNLLGGSSAARRYHCAASYELEQGIPDLGSSPAASRGTRLHAAAAQMVAGREPTDVTPDEVRDVLRPALAAFDDLCDRYDIQEVLVERRVDPRLPMPSFGTVDIIGTGSKHVLVLDWKFGYHQVSAAGNQQLRYYAYAALMDPKVGSRLAGREKLVVAIIQPADGDAVVSTEEVTFEELQADAAVWSANYVARDSDPVKGDHCKWCKAKPVCPAHVPELDDSLERQMAAQVEEAHAPTAMDEYHGGAGVLTLLKGLPMHPSGAAAEVGPQLRNWREIRDWCSSRVDVLERVAFNTLEAGEEVPGWKLVEKRAHRTWSDPEAAERMLRRKLGADGAAPRKLISPPQAEKVLGADYKKLAAKYVTKESTGVTLAPVDSELDAVDATSRFTVLGNALKEKS